VRYLSEWAESNCRFGFLLSFIGEGVKCKWLSSTKTMRYILISLFLHVHFHETTSELSDPAELCPPADASGPSNWSLSHCQSRSFSTITLSSHFFFSNSVVQSMKKPFFKKMIWFLAQHHQNREKCLNNGVSKEFLTLYSAPAFFVRLSVMVTPAKIAPALLALWTITPTAYTF
jgi:hypothetical protein